MIIEVPHFASLRGEEREIAILRSDDGLSWREHTPPTTEDAIHDMLDGHFEGWQLFTFSLSLSVPTVSSTCIRHECWVCAGLSRIHSFDFFPLTTNCENYAIYRLKCLNYNSE